MTQPPPNPLAGGGASVSFKDAPPGAYYDLKVTGWPKIQQSTNLQGVPQFFDAERTQPKNDAVYPCEAQARGILDLNTGQPADAPDTSLAGESRQLFVPIQTGTAGSKAHAIREAEKVLEAQGVSGDDARLGPGSLLRLAFVREQPAKTPGFTMNVFQAWVQAGRRPAPQDNPVAQQGGWGQPGQGAPPAQQAPPQPAQGGWSQPEQQQRNHVHEGGWSQPRQGGWPQQPAQGGLVQPPAGPPPAPTNPFAQAQPATPANVPPVADAWGAPPPPPY